MSMCDMVPVDSEIYIFAIAPSRVRNTSRVFFFIA
jgi:hypothetical protein